MIQDRVHFFTAAERTKINQFKTVVTATNFYKNLDGTFDAPEYNNMVFGRGDLLLTQDQNVFARYAWQDSDYQCEGCASASNQPFFGGAAGLQQKRYSFAGAHTYVISSRILNEVRGQWTNYHFRQHPPGARAVEDLYDDSSDRTAPLTPVYNFPSISWGTSGNFYTTQRSRQIRDDMTINDRPAYLEVRVRRPEPDNRGRQPAIARHLDVQHRSAVRSEHARDVAAPAGHGHAVRVADRSSSFRSCIRTSCTTPTSRTSGSRSRT